MRVKVLNIFDLIPAITLPLLSGLHPFFLLGIYALLINLGGGWIFKRVSNQPLLESITKATKIDLMELRLRHNNFLETVAINLRILSQSLSYLRRSLLPSTVIIVPILLCLISLDQYFAYWPVRVGDIFTIRVDGEQNSGGLPILDIGGLPRELSFVEEDPLLHRWVLKANARGIFTVNFLYDDRVFTKTVMVGDRPGKISPTNQPKNVLDWFYDSGEQPLPLAIDGGAFQITVMYRPIVSSVDIFGWRMDWLSFFIVASFAFVLVTKKVWGIA